MIWVLKLHGALSFKMSLGLGIVNPGNLILIGSVEILAVDNPIS